MGQGVGEQIEVAPSALIEVAKEVLATTDGHEQFNELRDLWNTYPPIILKDHTI